MTIIVTDYEALRERSLLWQVWREGRIVAEFTTYEQACAYLRAHAS